MKPETLIYHIRKINNKIEKLRSSREIMLSNLEEKIQKEEIKIDTLIEELLRVIQAALCSKEEEEENPYHCHTEGNE